MPVNEAVATLQSPQLAEETDVVIIGSGITGCSIARHLLQEYDSLMITVLEARTICSGATGRNGGHMKAVPEFSYASLLSALEKEAADEVVRFTLANVDELLKVAEDLAPDLVASSEIRKVESLNLFTDEDALSEFRVLLDIFERHNARRGRLVTSEELKEVCATTSLTFNSTNILPSHRSTMSTTLPEDMLPLQEQGGPTD